EQLELLVLLGLGRQGVVAFSPDLYFQRTALVDPFAVRVGLLQLVAGIEGLGGLAFLVLRVGLPIEGCFGTFSMELNDIGENRFRLRPAGIVDGSCSIRVERIFFRLSIRVED